MARPPSRPTPPFVDIHGKPIDILELAGHIAQARAGRSDDEFGDDGHGESIDASASTEPHVVEAVFEALCLVGGSRGRTWLTQFLRLMERRFSASRAIAPTDVTAALRELVAQGRAQPSNGMGHEAVPKARDAWLLEHLEPDLAAKAWGAWAHASGSYSTSGRTMPRVSLKGLDDHVNFARLLMFSGLDAPAFAQQRAYHFGFEEAAGSLAEAALKPFMPRRFEQLHESLRQALLDEWCRRFDMEAPLWTPLLRWLHERFHDSPAALPIAARVTLAEWRTEQADVPGSVKWLDGLLGPAADACRAAHLAVQGQWDAAVTAFSAALKAMTGLTKTRRGLLSGSQCRLYLMALMAQASPQAWTTARKLALAESGSRKSAPQGWGLWAHAAAVRLGDEAIDPEFFEHGAFWSDHPKRNDADRLFLAAWLGHAPKPWPAKAVDAIVAHFDDLGRTVRSDLVRQAVARLGWAAPQARAAGTPWEVASFGQPQEAWRDALAAIAALADTKTSATRSQATDGTLLWQLTVDHLGRVVDIEPYERPASARSRAQPKSVPLSRIKKSQTLDPRDAAVARCIEKSSFGGSTLGLNVVAAAVALINHPGVILGDDAQRPVELREALPEMEVRRVRQADGHDAFEFHLLDTLTQDAEMAMGEHWVGNSWAEETARRNALRVFREGDDRARLIRITPAQRRVAELVSQRWTVPLEAKAELEAALKVLAGHFQLHSDADAGEAVSSDARLIAQLVPRGDDLQLRLVVRPFGTFGPSVHPGRGRERLLTMHEGLQLSTRRALATEASHLSQVFEALPFLADTDAGDATWLLDDPEQALHVLEVLPGLPAVASLDWPKGKPVRVTALSARQVQVSLSSRGDWFTVDGDVQVDDARVLSLQKLMDLMHESRQGRFVALGEGNYLALTEQLRAQLADLNALSARDKSGLHVPAAAANFLAQTLDGLSLAGDPPWMARIARLEQAAALEPQVPRNLMAELRGYQQEGFVWMARLAHAGVGAILADDMGLGKTVQTLALLLSRASLGPALVIAPTSVCGNWSAEATRFAPSLRVMNFGEGDRTDMLQQCGPGDLVIASYGLTQIEGDAFAERAWATLVLDEAQALKNAATKRAKAIGTLQADFRLALSGTPVENRLGDLWSLMNLLNPGLFGTAGQFNERFAGPIERQRDDAVRSRLRRLVSPLLLRRTKAQVLADLPPRTEIIHRVEPGPEERAFLEATRRNAVERVEALDGEDPQAAFHVLAELTRLRRAACDPRLAAPDLALVGAKVQAFEKLALELVAGRHKALVFSQFTDFLDLLSQRLQTAGVSHQLLTGSTPAAERTRRVAAFQAGEGDLFLISLKAGGFGLNLTAADYVIITDPWWNPAAEDQASGRAHRMGQQRPVTVYRLVTAGSIEERIIDLHRHKRDLADGILEGQDQGKPLGAAELRALLDLD